MTIDEIVQQSRASQNKVELKKVLTFVGEIHPKVVVEIGTHQGFSALDFYRAFDPDVLITIELDPHAVHADFSSLPKDRVHLVVGNSHDKEVVEKVRQILNGKQIDFLYIDGDHRFEAVKADFSFYEPMVREGGIVGFDDIMLTDWKYREAGVEVNRFWNILIREPGTKYHEFWDMSQIAGFGSGDGIWYKPPKKAKPVIGVTENLHL